MGSVSANEKVAKFLFDYKGGSYAASKEDGSERNARRHRSPHLFGKKSKNPLQLSSRKSITTITRIHPIHTNRGGTSLPFGVTPRVMELLRQRQIVFTTTTCPPNQPQERIYKSSAGAKKISKPLRSANNCFLGSPKIETRGFDMGTKWGEAKESRVVEVDFREVFSHLPQTSFTQAVKVLLRWEFRLEMKNK